MRQIALSLSGVSEEPHFEKTSFRIKKKIFATYDAKLGRLVVKLSPIDQASFCSFDKTIVYPVPNKWGQQGWTLINLEKVGEETLFDALQTAHKTVSSAK